MATKKKTRSKKSKATKQTPPASYAAQAKALSAELARFVAKLGLGKPISDAQRVKLRTGYEMSDAYIQAASVIADKHGAQVGSTGGAPLLDAVRRNGAMQPLAAQFAAAGKLVEDTLYADIARAGLEARAIEDTLDSGVNRRGIDAFVQPLSELRGLRKTKRATRPRKKPTRAPAAKTEAAVIPATAPPIKP